jgi:hypothetical protein
MSYYTVRSAQKAIWPAVAASIERHRLSRAQTEKDGVLATAAARARARVPWNRVVANETVWALAKADLLATPEQAAVLSAAKAWTKSWQGQAPSLADGYEQDDVQLYRAVQALLTVVDIPDDVPFTAQIDRRRSP